MPHWVELLGRAGYIAKGVVYFVVGFLAFQLAIGAGGQISGARGAIREIGQQPFGRVLLGLIAIGLIGYTAWRLVQAGKDTEGDGTDAKGIAKRTGYVISGISYLLLGFFAASLALGIATSSGQSDAGQGFLLGSLWGRIVLGLIGAGVIGAGLAFGYKAYNAKFMTKYNLAEMTEKLRTIALYAGRVGLTTRGVAFILIGGFLLSSAVQGTSSEDVTGLADALAVIASQSYGKVLLAVTGFGLMCYAVHTLMQGWFRVFNVSKL
ncbi:membrane protein containing DUF1206 [Rhodopirellula maiorica SM1]|uniref:Membrane protein containing DUF1206 n=1 Tax=Rhodopirellula maiorica SM1 TaxID=1265738 RepID=M5RK56_9BACT|nr:membrane protein containing DUF1206 [Rhodopirellula maiorica SM1]